MALGAKMCTDELLLLYENILVLGKPAEVQNEVLAYATLAENEGDATQKLRAITFLEKVSVADTGATVHLEAFVRENQR